MAGKQSKLDLGGKPSAGDVLEHIRSESRDESEKGRWFEQLFMRIALQDPDYEIQEIWRWPDWPEREELTGLDARDIGIDLVAKRHESDYVAIQCKCYKEGHTLGKGDIDKFLGGSQQQLFGVRWIVSTCGLGPNAKSAILRAVPHVTHIDFRNLLDVTVEEEDAERIVQNPWPMQEEAIESVVEGLRNQDRGRLIMACGTGKTFSALRIAEKIVNDGGRILFAAPSIALVSQARHEWLRHSTRELGCLVVCSDSTAGGRGENEDIGISELECPVTTDPKSISERLTCSDVTSVIFCTYQSLQKVTEAQAKYAAPTFDLAIADEAHRTTGIKSGSKMVDYQEFHERGKLHTCKRLYMTATPRTYNLRSKKRLTDRGIEVVDMNDHEVYGRQLYSLPFSVAVNNRLLSDYRVIVLGVNAGRVTPGLRRRLEELHSAEKGSKKRGHVPTTSEMTKVLGVSLAVNGITKGEQEELPIKLSRTIAYANTIERSKWFANAIMDSEVLRATTRRIRADFAPDGQAQKVIARHLDASASAHKRKLELQALDQAGKKGECRIVCNVRLFTEGVDVPQLDSVAFLDPRSSQVDVVQAVGRVMRKAPGKRFGYIIVPIVVDPGKNVIDALIQGTDGYKTIGLVLRALQAHDGRLSQSFEEFILVREVVDDPNGGIISIPPGGAVIGETGPKGTQGGIEFEQIYARVAAASGLGKPGQFVADEILDVVKHTSRVFQEESLDDKLAEALDLVTENDGGAKGVCTIAALMLCNACLLHRRLRDEPGMEKIEALDKLAIDANPKKVLVSAWKTILAIDYAPVFRPALSALSALPENSKVLNDAILLLAECSNRIADSLSELGYDHAGPLYHRILGSATSDGAFYTNNLSAIMLSRLAFPKNLINWADQKTVSKLRIMDPACGTGTLLMATLKTIKDRISENVGGGGEMSTEKRNALHKLLVEDVLCGLDINQHGIQLAACNMTLGAPTVDYKRMNLVTMPHGPQSAQLDAPCLAGSLELLDAAESAEDLRSVISPIRNFDSLEGSQVDDSKLIQFPLRDLDAVIMNAPYTANENRNKKYSKDVRERMQLREQEIKDHVESRVSGAKGTITANSIATFFTPLADILLNKKRGILAKVIPTTACTGTAGLAERKFLADRFHIETVVTSHDPKRPNFSENTSIHESLLICRRRSSEAGNTDKPTRFISLCRMPATRTETFDVVDAIQNKEHRNWYTEYEQSEELVRSGDWRACQFVDPKLVRMAVSLEKKLTQLGKLCEIGPAGQGIRMTFSPIDDEEGFRVFWGRSKDLRTTMRACPEQVVQEKNSRLADRYKSQAGNLLLATKFNTVSGRLLAIYSDTPSLGSMWVPVESDSICEDNAKALCAWFNSTLGSLGFFIRRGGTLANPGFSQAAFSELPIPDFKKNSLSKLTDAYERTKDQIVKPWKNASDDKVRAVLDEASARITGIEINQIRKIRERISNEPTISNVPATVGD